MLAGGLALRGRPLLIDALPGRLSLRVRPLFVPDPDVLGVVLPPPLLAVVPLILQLHLPFFSLEIKKDVQLSFFQTIVLKKFSEENEKMQNSDSFNQCCGTVVASVIID